MDSAICRLEGQWGQAGGQRQVGCWRQRMGSRVLLDADPWTCQPPPCRQPGSWFHVGREWLLSQGWSTELGGVSSHFWPVAPPPKACTLAWR